MSRVTYVLQMMATDVAATDKPAFRLQEWFEPGRFARLFGQLQPFDEHMKVEEEVVGTDLVIRAEIPGVDPAKDIDITVDDGVLTLHAERRKEETKKENGGFRSEFSYGSFSRSMSLPKGATAKDCRRDLPRRHSRGQAADADEQRISREGRGQARLTVCPFRSSPGCEAGANVAPASRLFGVGSLDPGGCVGVGKMIDM